MSPRKRLCVFCGASLPAEPAFAKAAAELGRLLGASGVDLVYGGGRVGLMGVIADAAIAAGSSVIGVIPSALHGREIGHPGLAELVVVPDMHERKRQMFALSDAVAVLAGGLGTLDEAFEAITLRQLGFFDKPIVLVDTIGYWQPLAALIEHIVANGFARADVASLYTMVAEPAEVLTACFESSAFARR